MSSLSAMEKRALHAALKSVLQTAVDCDADSDKYPKGWIFHSRWNKGRRNSRKKKAESVLENEEKDSALVDGHKVVFKTVGGRTSAFVPALQKKNGGSDGAELETASNEEEADKGKQEVSVDVQPERRRTRSSSLAKPEVKEGFAVEKRARRIAASRGKKSTIVKYKEEDREEDEEEVDEEEPAEEPAEESAEEAAEEAEDSDEVSDDTGEVVRTKKRTRSGSDRTVRAAKVATVAATVTKSKKPKNASKKASKQVGVRKRR